MYSTFRHSSKLARLASIFKLKCLVLLCLQLLSMKPMVKGYGKSPILDPTRLRCVVRQAAAGHQLQMVALDFDALVIKSVSFLFV